ncbi:MAG: tetratricopeptide repeat protein [Candidatus Puniceispirillales bacterium]|jgi:cytochrome c-type biogenesis protein CcmH
MAKEKLIKKTIIQEKNKKEDLKIFEELVYKSKENPNNINILLDLAATASRINKIDIEISTLTKILSIKSSPKLKSLLAQAIVRKADGQVTSKAQILINQALSENSTDPGANFLNGLLQSQIGNEKKAFEIWTKLYRNTSTNDAWEKDLVINIRSAAKNLGISDKVLNNNLKKKLKTNSPIANEILNLNEKDQKIRINQMVEQLASRLTKNKNDLDGWIKLYKSYKVLDYQDKAINALRTATKISPENLNLKQILLKELLPPEKEPIFSAEIEQLVNEILANEPKNINALFFRGLRAFKEGENKIAIENWTLLLDQIPPGSQMALELLKKINNLKN